MFLDIDEVQFEFGGELRRNMRRLVRLKDGKVLPNLCFEAVLHTIQRVYAISGKAKLQQKRKKLQSL